MLDAAQQASLDQFDKQSGRYGSSHILANTADVARALEGLSFAPNAEALDVATGGGHTAVFLAARGMRVTASDLSPAMLENTARLAAEKGLSLTTVQHEAERFPFADGSFDLVTCRVAAHHFSRRAEFLSEVRRVLRVGGYFLLIDGSVPDDAPEAAEWIHRVEKLRDPSHGRFLPPKEWQGLCETSGLQVLRCGTIPFKQPDLEWYFQTAATEEESRRQVRELVKNAPEQAREVFQIAEEGERIVWWWPRVALLAQRVD
ncbi:MAG: class I SAM-dependent methyltransferase [Chthoniobacterales bacterium]